ncbi:MAG: zinc-binding metallopeptidase family protein, partial [Acidimicrobiales bacterium]
VPVVDGVRISTAGAHDTLLRLHWMPAMEVTGAGGLPPVHGAANVIRTSTTLRLSVRVPPTCDAQAAAEALTTALTEDPPDGAQVTVAVVAAEDGWDAPADAPWLHDALGAASTAAFGHPPARTGIGGSIPFIGMLGRRFPDTWIVVTGALGADSNLHGPNESLYLPAAEDLTVALAVLLDAHARSARHERRATPQMPSLG